MFGGPLMSCICTCVSFLQLPEYVHTFKVEIRTEHSANPREVGCAEGLRYPLEPMKGTFRMGCPHRHETGGERFAELITQDAGHGQAPTK